MLSRALWGFCLALILGLALRSPPPPNESLRRFPHHLRPIRELGEHLLQQAEEWLLPTTREESRARHRAWREDAELVRSTGLPIPGLDSTHSRMELKLAQDLVRFGQEDFASWHLLQALQEAQARDDLIPILELSRRIHAWRALGMALARVDPRADTLEAIVGKDPRITAEILDWMARELAERGQLPLAQHHWQTCAQLGRVSCLSALGRHGEALARDPRHWPSLQATHTKEPPR